MKKLYFALLGFLALANNGKAQTASQYYFKYKTGVALETIKDSIVVFGANIDDSISGSIAFFPFTFAGKGYDHFFVNENGVVVLGDAAYKPYPYDDYVKQTPALLGQTAAYPILLPWGEDLYTASNGAVAYKMIGSAPARKLVIEFKVNSAEDHSDAYNKTFQIWLQEGTNTIQYVYGDISFDWYNNANVGIAASGTDFISVNTASNTAGSSVVAMNSNGSYTPYVQGTLPTKGTAYVFSPTEIVEPSAPVSASVSMSPNYPVAGQKWHTVYLGYGAQSVVLSATASGGNPSAAGYTYSWSSSDGLFSSTAANPSVSPKATTTYTVTISDGNGNKATQSIIVYTIDPRYGDKFKVCKSGRLTICISKEAVDTQLGNGAALGDCSVALGLNSISMSMDSGGKTLAEDAVSVYPNPSAGAFDVRLPQAAKQNIITVFDAGGKIVARKTVGENNPSAGFNLAGNPPGVYLIKIASDGKVQNRKIIIK